MPQLLDVSESANFLGLSSSTIRRWAQNGELKGKKVGSRGDWRFTKEELTKMLQLEKNTFARVKIFLNEYAKQIQELSTQKHKQLLSGGRLPTYSQKHKREHVQVVKKLARNLENFERGKRVFTKLGETLAKKAVKENLNLEEAVDGLVFIRQAIWEKLEQEGLLKLFTVEDFYTLSHIFSTYNDILTAKLTFTYQEKYAEEKKEQLKKQKEIEREEKRKEETLQATFEQAAVGMAHVAIDGNWIMVNQRLCDIVGYPKNELLQLNFQKITFPEDLHTDLTFMKKLLSGKIPHYSMEKRYIRKDKSLVWVNLTVSLARDSKNKPKYFISVIEDISKSKQSESAQAQLAAIVASAVDAIISKTTDNVITSWNDGATRLFGYTSKEAIGKPIDIIIPEDKMAEEKRVVRKVKKGLTVQNYETVHKGKNGKRIDISASISPIKNSEGKIVGISKIAHDITSLKEDQRKLNEALEHNSMILESISDAFYALDHNWNFTYVNKKAASLWERDAKSLLGKNIWKVFPNAVGSYSYNKHFEVIKTRKPTTYDIISPVLDTWIEANIYPSNDGLSVYFHDITERKKLEQRKDDFIALASHELKTPLTSMKLFTQALEHRFAKDGDTYTKKYLSNMDTQLNKLTGIVNSLLDITRVEKGKLEYKKEKFSIDALIKETVESLQGIDMTHNIEIIGKADVDVIADRDRISQVLINLITNAIKYSPHGNKVIVRAKKENKHVVIAVQDFGIGIPKNQQEKIFDRFFQANDSRTFPGLGLGLYITKEIVEQHKGKLWVESKENKGSTFFLTLPTLNNHKRKE